MIYLLLMKNSIMGYLEYRANLFAALAMEAIFLFSKLLYVLVFFNSSIKINGITPYEIMIFIGTFILTTAVYTGFFMDNFYQIPEHIRTGTLDIYITKPVSLQFITTLRHFNIARLTPNLIAGVILITTAWGKLGIPVSFAKIAGYILALISATFITYAVFLAPQILSFWFVKSSGITEIADKCWDFNNMPMAIYGKRMQWIGIFVIPVFFITNLPAMYLLGELSSVYLVWMFLAPLLFMWLIRRFWKTAVLDYTSASS